MTVVPFIVMVAPKECSTIEDFDVRKHDQYNYFVIGGSHSVEVRQQLVREHPTTFFFKYTECKIYVGLTTEEAKLMEWNHNNDNDYWQKMSSIEQIRFFHHEYLGVKQKMEKYGTYKIKSSQCGRIRRSRVNDKRNLR